MRIGYVIRIALIFVALAVLGSAALVCHWHLDGSSAVAIADALIVAIPLIAVLIAWNWLFQIRAKSIVQEWAAKHGYTILHIKSPFHTGAFSSWDTSRGQVVYSVTIQDKEGAERNAWVRCGGYSRSVLFSLDIEVKWSDESKAA